MDFARPSGMPDRRRCARSSLSFLINIIGILGKNERFSSPPLSCAYISRSRCEDTMMIVRCIGFNRTERRTMPCVCAWERKRETRKRWSLECSSREHGKSLFLWASDARVLEDTRMSCMFPRCAYVRWERKEEGELSSSSLPSSRSLSSSRSRGFLLRLSVLEECRCWKLVRVSRMKSRSCTETSIRTKRFRQDRCFQGDRRSSHLAFSDISSLSVIGYDHAGDEAWRKDQYPLSSLSLDIHADVNVSKPIVTQSPLPVSLSLSFSSMKAAACRRTGINNIVCHFFLSTSPWASISSSEGESQVQIGSLMIMSFSLPIAMHTASSERNQQIYTHTYTYKRFFFLLFSVSLSLGGVFFLYRPIISLPFAIPHRRKQITEKMKGRGEGKEKEGEEEERNRETTSLPTYITSLFFLSLSIHAHTKILFFALFFSLSLCLSNTGT